MGKPILLLRLEGPLQSWGTRARWDVRDTAPEPTKSGVLGLLGCALGYRRGDERLLELDQKLRFGVRVENAGRFITDYQTITDYLPTAAGEWKGRDSRTRSPREMRAVGATPATIISPRDYLEDAAFLAGLEAREGGEAILEEAARAVQEPCWPLFLGRKACIPTRPIFEAFIDEFDDLEDAFHRYEWDWRGTGEEARPFPRRPLQAWLESNDPSVPGAVQRHDALRLNAARVYDFRAVRPLSNLIPPNLAAHVTGGTP